MLIQAVKCQHLGAARIREDGGEVRKCGGDKLEPTQHVLPFGGWQELQWVLPYPGQLKSVGLGDDLQPVTGVLLPRNRALLEKDERGLQPRLAPVRTQEVSGAKADANEDGEHAHWGVLVAPALQQALYLAPTTPGTEQMLVRDKEILGKGIRNRLAKQLPLDWQEKQGGVRVGAQGRYLPLPGDLSLG